MHRGHFMRWSNDIFLHEFSRGPPKKNEWSPSGHLQFPFMQVFIHNFYKDKFDLERVFLGKAWKMTERSITVAWAWFWVNKPHGFTSLVLLNHSWGPFSGDVGSLQVFGIILIPPLSSCAVSLSIFSPKSRQHNCKHFYCTLESHIFPPHISFYCMAPVFCFHFPSNKALISFKGGELMTPSSKFSGRSHRGNRGSLGGCNAFTPCRQGKNPNEVLSADVYSVFSTLRKVVILGGFYGVIL